MVCPLQNMLCASLFLTHSSKFLLKAETSHFGSRMMGPFDCQLVKAERNLSNCAQNSPSAIGTEWKWLCLGSKSRHLVNIKLLWKCMFPPSPKKAKRSPLLAASCQQSTHFADNIKVILSEKHRGFVWIRHLSLKGQCGRALVLEKLTDRSCLILTRGIFITTLHRFWGVKPPLSKTITKSARQGNGWSGRNALAQQLQQGLPELSCWAHFCSTPHVSLAPALK